MLVVANWKAYVEDAAKAKKLFAAAKRLAAATRISIVLAPSAPQIGLFALKNVSRVALGAQDVSEATGGPQTGEMTAAVLNSLGVKYVIVGHSERRARGEGDALIATKLERVVAEGLTPILCVGEQARDSEGSYLRVIREQISSALAPLSPKDRTRVIIAYEPVWAIGKSAAEAIQVTDLAEMVLYIRKVLAELYPGKAGSDRSLVLYGGSVESDNIRDLAGGSRVDGFLVGHASAEPATFSALIKALA